jgi:hypothetical protein
MTDAPRFPDDELLSAYLDGEVTADERARVEADPALLARVAELRAAAALAARPVAPADAAQIDVAIRVAVAASDVPMTGGGTNVTDLSAHRKKPGVGAWLGAAAAILLFVIIAATLVRNADTKTSKTAASSGSSLSSAAASQFDQREAATAAAATSVIGGDLGAFPDEVSLTAGARARLAQGAAGPSTGAATPTAADTAAQAPSPDATRAAACSVGDPTDGTVVLDQSGTLRGTSVRVVVRQRDDGARVLIVVDEGCRVLLRQSV